MAQNYKVTYEDSQVVSILLTTYHYTMPVPFMVCTNTRGLVYNKITGQRVPLYNYVKIANAEQLDRGLRSYVLDYYTGSSYKEPYSSGLECKICNR